jgi:penicillin-binding protein 1A
VHDPREWDSLGLVLARRRRGRHGVGRVAAWVAGVVVFAILLTAGIGVAAVALFLRDPATVVGCDLDAEHPRRLGRSSFLYARDGSRLGAVPSSRNRQPVRLSRMGRWLPAATVAIEDRRFWQRRMALDYEAIARAALANLRAGRTVQGGSTIQQQLARDRYLRDRRPVLSRKLEEACLAVQLGQWVPRHAILESYLNGAFYGHHAY